MEHILKKKTKEKKHVPVGYALDHYFLIKIKIFNILENHLCMNLKKQTINITNTEEKDMLPLTDEEKWRYNSQRKCYICHKEFLYNPENEYEYRLL